MRNIRLLVLITLWAGSLAAPPAHAEDRREVDGRALFAKGEYERALDVYANLFATRGEAIYLRNIGRCYQKLKRPDKSIDAFREYLRRARVKPAERSEVEGFIKEMEELRQSQQAVAASVAPLPLTAPPRQAEQPAVAPPPVSAPIPPPLPAPASSPPAAVLIQDSSSRSEPEETRPIIQRWWFWTGIGAVVVGGVVAAVLLSNGGGSAVVPMCAPPAECPR